MTKKKTKTKKKIILRNFQAPGDIVMLAYAVKSLHESHPGKYETDVRVSAPEVFEGSPYLTAIADDDKEAATIDLQYPTIHLSNQRPVHFVNSFTVELARILGEDIQQTPWSGAITIRPEEHWWLSAVYEILKKDVPYWIIDAGHKKDYTAKAWSFARYQQLVDDCPDVWFVQVGLKHEHHVHPPIKGKNVIDLVGKTDTRQLIRLVYNSFGVITPVSFPMLLAYAVPPHPRFGRQSRACVVLAGGREPNTWQQGPNQHYLHTCGMLSCCDMGGCWKSRVVPLGDGDSKDNDLCVSPVRLPDGQWIPKCMEMISVEDVTRIIDKYMANLEYEPRN